MLSHVASALRRCCGFARVLYRCFLEARPAVQDIFLLRLLAGASFAGPLFIEGINFSPWVGQEVYRSRPSY